MSDHQKENALRIADYLGNKLSPEARDAFKRALGEDDELRLQYVEALMNRAGTGAGTGGTAAAASGAEVGGAEGGDSPGAAGDTDQGVTGASAGSGHHGSVGASAGEGPDDTGAAGMGESEEIVREAGIGERETIPVDSAAAGDDEASGDNEAFDDGSAARGGLFGRVWMLVAAVLLLLAAGVYVYVKVSGGGAGEMATAGVDSAAGKGLAAAAGDGSQAAGNRADSAKPVNGGAGKAAGGGPGVDAGARRGLADSEYARLYKPYMRGDDPAELRGFYRDYRTGNYAAVLAAGDSSVKGVGARALLVRDYMRLYTGLSYLATGNARDAVNELDGVVLRTKPGDMLYETAEWYLALAWLKRSDVDAAEATSKALELARDIAHSYSRYRGPARGLIRALRL